MTQDPAPLSSLMGYRLKEVDAALRGTMDARLRPLSLSTAQYACLELLRRSPGASTAELARGAFVTRQSMHTLLRSLQERGLVARAESSPVGRALPTRLTTEGEELLGAAVGVIARVEGAMAAAVSPAEREVFMRVLGSCLGALSELDAGDDETGIDEAARSRGPANSAP